MRPTGRVLRPQDLGVMSSVGLGMACVVRRPRVRLVVTGNELLPSGSRPEGVRIGTTRDRYSAGALVLTAGAGMGELVTELRPHLRVERQLVAHFAAASESAALALGVLPIFCLEEPNGAFYYGFPDLGTGCKIGRHHGDADIADIRGFIARRLPQANGALMASDECLYTNTPDFHFVVDRHPRHAEVIVASVCSGHGFKFAAVMGEIVADLLQGTRPAFDLSMFRLARLV